MPPRTLDGYTPNKVCVLIRGSNAVGKSTSVRQFIGMHNDAEIIPIKTEGKPPVYVTRFGKNIFALGRYDVSSPGADRYSNKLTIIRTIKQIIETYSPSAIILEGVIVGSTYRMSFDICNFVGKYGYKYQTVALERPMRSVIALLEARNGGADYNPSTILAQFEHHLSTTRKMEREQAFLVKRINADLVSYEDMWKIVAEQVYG